MRSGVGAVADPAAWLRRRLAAARRDLDGLVPPLASPTALGAESGLPAGVTAAGTAVALDALAYAAVRYAPEHLRLLGASPVVVGLFGAVGVALALFGRRLAAPTAAALAAVATLGLGLWALAGPLAAAVGLPAPALVLVGTVPLGLWVAVASPTVGTGPEAAAFLRHLPDRRGRHPVATVGGVLFATVVLAAGTALAGVRIVAALAAAVGVAATVAALVDGGGSDRLHVERDRLSLRGAVARLPAEARGLVLGDTLVRVALAVVSVFVVITVTTRLAGPTLGGLTPGAAFGFLLAVELAVGAVAARAGGRLVDGVGAAPLACWAAAVAAAFPLLLVSVPAGALVLGPLFAGFGTRFVAVDARRRLLREAVGGRLPAPTRTARDAATAAAPLVGGLSYGVSPTLAFGLATTLAAVGVHETLRHCYL